MFKFANMSFKSIVKWRVGPQWPPQKVNAINEDVQSAQNHSMLGSSSAPSVHNLIDDTPAYQSRVLKCLRPGCMGGTETAHMQLNTVQGYRNLQCTACHKQNRCKNWTCSHGLPWHECILHRLDPAAHGSTRGERTLGKADGRPKHLLPSNRHGPIAKVRKSAFPLPARRGVKRPLCSDVALGSDRVLYSLDPARCPNLAKKFHFSDRFVQPRTDSACPAAHTGVAGLHEPRDETP